MDNSVMVALFSLIGTLAGSLSGVMASNKLVTFRLEQLERKVDKYNNLVERMALVEKDVGAMRHVIDEMREERINEY